MSRLIRGRYITRRGLLRRGKTHSPGGAAGGRRGLLYPSHSASRDWTCRESGVVMFNGFVKYPDVYITKLDSSPRLFYGREDRETDRQTKDKANRRKKSICISCNILHRVIGKHSIRVVMSSEVVDTLTSI